ncbi:MAG TPA: adenylate/guanylate cyclase domain-containing protein [Nitriliruptorales bacterium]
MERDVNATPRWWRRPRSWPFQLAASAVATVVLTVAAAAGIATGLLDQERRSALDRFFPAGQTSPAVVVVEIDQPAVLEHGWPWDRRLHAELVDRLAEAGAAVIGYDIVFDLATDGDAELAAALRDAGNVVLASTGAVVPQPGRQIRRLAEPRSEPIAALAAAAAGVGLAHALDEDDGVVRSVPAIVEAPTGRTSSTGRELVAFRAGLAVAVLGGILGVDPDAPTLRPNGIDYGGQTFLAPADRDRFIDLNFSSELRWRSPRRQALPALDVLAGDFDPEQVRGRAVLVGNTDPLVKDFFRTPTARGGGGEPGVYIHAQALNSLLTGQYRPPIGEALALVTVAALVALVMLVSLRVPIWWVPAVVVVGLVLNHAWAAWRFGQGSASDLVYPSLAVILAGISAIVLRYVTELRERRRVAALFGQYVPPAVAKELIDSGRLAAATEGERVEITVFFCDLRGFTKAAAGLEPSEVRGMLNHYYEHVTSLVLDHSGTVMQYVGDEVFAIWGAPVRHDDHAQRAVDCAVAVRDSVDRLNADLAAGGLPPVAFGIGLNVGPVVAAHVGTFHKQYAVIGDTVNVGSRFCALAKEHQIALPGELRDRLTDPPPLLQVGPVAMKGVERDFEVFKVGRTSDATPEAAYTANLTVADDAPKAVELDPG